MQQVESGIANIMNQQPSAKIQNPLSFLRQTLVTVAEILERHDIIHWLDRGALLGVWRSGDLIPDDHDIDLRIMRRDWQPVYNQLAAQLPSHLVVTAMHHADVINNPDSEHEHLWIKNEDGEFPIAEEAHVLNHVGFHSATALVVHGAGTHWRDKPNLDLYCCRVNQHHECMSDDLPTPWVDDNREYLCLPANKPHSKLMPMELVFPLSEIELDGRTYPAPAKIEPYLEHIYGYLGEDSQFDELTKRWICTAVKKGTW